MASLITVRINKGDSPNLGFRLQGGKDFGTPLVVQKVNGGSPAERAGLIAGDSVIKINNTDVFNLRHKDAQDVVVRAGHNFEVTVQRGGSTWRPTVVSTGSFPTPTPSINHITPVTKTSLAATKGDNWGAVGTGHNVAAKPFSPQLNGAVNGGPKAVNKQYNSPIKLYSEESIAETLSAQTEVLPTGALGVNFKKNEKNYDASNSAVLRALKESENEPKSHDEEPDSGIVTAPNSGIAGLRHVQAPEYKPAPSNPQLPPGQNICADCERLIVGVFVRIKEKNLHVECFKCSTCGTSLKNVGYYNINNKLYCDIHAKSAAIRNSTNPNLVPVAVSPGGKAPAHAISSALASHSLPSPSPLSPKINNNYASPYQETKNIDVVSPLTETNNNTSSNVYSNTTPLSFNKFLNKSSSNISGPRPFSSVSSPLSPHSTLPRAPLSPVAPAPTSYSPASSTGRISSVKSAGGLFKGRSVPSIVWPPQQEKTDLPTACPLFYPPPSQVEQKLRKPESECDLESEATADCSELEEINNLQYLPMEMFSRRKSSTECVETIHETLETQKLVENVMKMSVETSSQVSGPTSVGISQCPSSLPPNECCKDPEACKITPAPPKLASKIENPVPLKWESSLTQAIRTTSPDRDTFSLIPPTKRSGTALGSALLIAPSQPFTPAKNQEGPVPLPEETVPYFPPERPVISPKEEMVEEPPKPKPKFEKSKTPFVKALETAPDRPFTPVGGAASAPPPPVKKKTKDPYEKYFEDLEKPSQKMSMLAALTIAPDRTYSPLTVETVEIEAPAEKESKIPAGIDKSSLQRPLKPENLPESFQMNKKDPKPPSYYTPSLLYERTEEIQSEETNTSTTTTIEKQTIQNPQVTQIVPNQSQSLCPPMFKGFTCSFQNKTSHSQFSVEIQTDPPIINNTAPMVQTVETQPSVIHKETIKEEKIEKKQEELKTIKQSEVETVAAKQAEEIIMIRASPQVALRKVETIPHYQVQLGLEAEADLFFAEKKRQAEVRMEQQKLERSGEQREVGRPAEQKTDTRMEQQTLQSSTEQKEVVRTAPQKEPVRQPQAPVIKIEPDLSQTFKPVEEERPPSRTFSPRPGTVTPSMINRPPSVLPYYQANLVPQHMAPVSANVFDPKSPAVSRSPSPHPGKRDRSPSPFPRSVEDVRAVSPAPGPPENPMEGSMPLPTPQDSRVNVARESLSTFIPEYKSRRDVVEKVQGIGFCKTEEVEEPVRMYVSTVQSQSFPLQLVERKEAEKIQAYSKSQNVQEQIFEAKSLEVQEAQMAQRIVSETSEGVVSKAIDEQHRLAHLEQMKQSQSQSVETSADGSTQVQRRRVVTEEFERTQKETNIQIETKTEAKRYPFQNVKGPSIDPIPSLGGRVADPQPIKAAKREAARRSLGRGASSSASPHSSLTPCVNPPSSVKDPNVSPESSGIGGGRQAGGVSVAPRRGRGVLNAASFAGSRVPLCGSCNTHIRGPFITALGKIWCPNHFICATQSCRRPLQDIGFVEERGQLYCEYCFEQYLAPPCSKCSGKIKGDCLKAIGKNFHPECFNCTYCGKLFANSPFFLEDGSPYCEADWNELFTTKCFACGFPVEAGDRWVEALNNNYHSQCFNCAMCKKNLEGQSFFAKGGRPFCKNHAR